MKIYEIKTYASEKGQQVIIHRDIKTGEQIFLGIVRIISEKNGVNVGQQDLQFKFPPRVKSLEAAYKCFDKTAEQRYKELQKEQEKRKALFQKQRKAQEKKKQNQVATRQAKVKV